MKYLYSTFTLLLISFALRAQAPWDGTTSEITPSGNVYSVGTAEELAWISAQSQSNDFDGKTVRLTADIDLGGTLEPARKWQPIGSVTTPFKGEFDGNNHVIRNLYISGDYSSTGLFGVIALGATVHNLAIAQGQIFTDGNNNVGCIAGMNYGTIHHCFNMAQILANNGDRIGGLVGMNDGEISYSYNTGLITKAKTQVGGLVGYNTTNAILNWCYNTGYCLGAGTIGALFGQNEAPAVQLTNVYFDQQTTRMDACGNSTEALDNAEYAIIKTKELKDKFAEETAEWVCPSKNAYPRLACFGSLPAAILSTYGIRLDTDGQPMERAEAVGTPKDSNYPRKTFKLDSEGNNVAWTSGNDAVIHIKDATTAETRRPCGNQEVYLTLTNGTDIKQIYTHVRGYNPFDPGELKCNNITVCWKEDGVRLETMCGGKEPSGGKDDEQNDSTGYKYMIIRYTVTLDAENNKVYEPKDTAYTSFFGYGKFTINTDEPGSYAFKRYVHDFLCTTSWTESPGYAYVTVREDFDAGELYDNVDTIYGLPTDTVVLSKVDAFGGGKKYTYRWGRKRDEVDYVTGEKISEGVYENVRDKNDDPIDSAICPVTFTLPGEYTFHRRVKEEICRDEYMDSKFEHHFVVFDSLRAGRIASIKESMCTPKINDTIAEMYPATGGNGRYSYRWLCNGEVIPDRDSTVLPLNDIIMTKGNTYVFRRQVKDDTGLMDWTTSKDSVSYTIYAPYKAGSIMPVVKHLCYGRKDTLSLRMQAKQSEAPQGDGGFDYCWLLYRSGAQTPMDTLHYNHPSLDTTLLLSSYAGLRLPVSLVVRRAVNNTLCPATWEVSNDSVEWNIGYTEITSKTVRPCTADLPYRDTYQYQDGRTQTYTLGDGESITFDDMTKDGCTLTHTVNCRAYKRPNVEVQPIVSACQSDTALILKYKLLEGKPNAYDVTFSAEAEAAGFVSIQGGTMPSGNEIYVPVPEHPAYGNYSFTLLFYTADASGTPGCTSEVQSLSFAMNMDGFVHRKWNDVVFVDNSDKNCAPNCDEDLTFVAYQWYKDGEPIPGATEQSYYEAGGLNGHYQVLMTASDGTVYRSCEYEMRPVQALDNVQSPVRLYPIPALAGMPIQVNTEEEGEMKVYNLQGNCCATFSLRAGQQQIAAPTVPGIYLMRFVSAYKNMFTSKMIVL